MTKEKYVVLDIETTGLRPWKGNKITCICAKCHDDDGTTFGNTLKSLSERELLVKFINWILEKKKEGYKLITQCGKDFDVPFIMTRGVYNGISLNILKSFLDMEHFDLQDIANRKVSLNVLAKLFNCNTKIGSGMQAIKLYKMEKWGELFNYCKEDVNITKNIYDKWKKLQEKK